MEQERGQWEQQHSGRGWRGRHSTRAECNRFYHAELSSSFDFFAVEEEVDSAGVSGLHDDFFLGLHRPFVASGKKLGGGGSTVGGDRDPGVFVRLDDDSKLARNCGGSQFAFLGNGGWWVRGRRGAIVLGCALTADCNRRRGDGRSGGWAKGWGGVLALLARPNGKRERDGEEQRRGQSPGDWAAWSVRNRLQAADVLFTGAGHVSIEPNIGSRRRSVAGSNEIFGDGLIFIEANAARICADEPLIEDAPG